MPEELRVLAGTVGEIRFAQFQGRDHMVLPVVALVEGVLHASNMPEPEFASAAVFSKAPSGWNGEPVLCNHPKLEGEPCSANIPVILEQQCIGRIFNTHVVGDQLHMEAWVDIARAAEVGGPAAELEARVAEGDRISVSVGCYVLSEARTGIFKGRQYQKAWVEVVSDHLAILERGSDGACSFDMGCGIRAAAEFKEEGNMGRLKQLLDRWTGVTSAEKEAHLSAVEDISSRELHGRLWDALYSMEPAFLGIDELFPMKNEVIYAVAPNGAVQLFRRTFSVEADGTVKIDKAKVEVVHKSTYEAAESAEEPAVEQHAACGCGGHNNAVVPSAAGEEQTMEKKPRVSALIAHAKTPWTEEDRVFLEGLNDDRLAAFEQAIPEEAAPAAHAEKAPLTEEQYLQQAPKSIQEIVRAHTAAQAAQKTSLITQLKAIEGQPFSDAELQEKAVEELEKLAALTGVVAPRYDFSAAGLPREGRQAETIPSAPSMFVKKG